jgi:hypothetical protein
MNNDVATLIWLVITYNYCKWYFIRHTIDVLEEKGVLDLEDEQK